MSDLVVGYAIKDRLGQTIFGTNTYFLGQPQTDLRAGEIVNYQFHFSAQLGVGSYSVAVALHTGDTHLQRNYEWRDYALLFNVINANQPTFVGVAWIAPSLEISR
jgi:lipopolysaccharide transport system ATP-binding protein